MSSYRRNPKGDLLRARETGARVNDSEQMQARSSNGGAKDVCRMLYCRLKFKLVLETAERSNLYSVSTTDSIVRTPKDGLIRATESAQYRPTR